MEEEAQGKWKCQKGVKNYWVIRSNMVLIRRCRRCRLRQRLRGFTTVVPRYLQSPSPCQVISANPSCPFSVGRARSVFAQNVMTVSLQTPCVLLRILTLQLLEIHTILVELSMHREDIDL